MRSVRLGLMLALLLVSGCLEAAERSAAPGGGAVPAGSGSETASEVSDLGPHAGEPALVDVPPAAPSTDRHVETWATLREAESVLVDGGFERDDGLEGWMAPGARRDCTRAAEGDCSLAIPHEGQVHFAERGVPHDPDVEDSYAVLRFSVMDPDARWHTWEEDPSAESYVDNWFVAQVQLDPEGPKPPAATNVVHHFLLTQPTVVWREVLVGPVPIPAGTTAVVVRFEARGSGGPTWIDDVRLAIGPAPMQLATDASFEGNGTENGSWTLGAGASVDCLDAHEGRCSLALDATSPDAWASQVVAPSGDWHELHLAFWYEATGNATTAVRVEVLDADGDVVHAFERARIGLEGPHEWRHHRDSPVSTSWGSAIRITFHAVEGAPGALVRFDALALQARQG